MKTAEQILNEIRSKTAHQGETYINIKDNNSKDIRYKNKDKREVSALSPEGQPGSGETCESQGLCEPNLGHHYLPTATSSTAPQVSGGANTGSELSIHYAKITTRRNRRNGSLRKKINFDFVKSGSNNINKLTFNTTPKLSEWARDLERDYKLGKLTDADWAWYERIIQEYTLAKQHQSQATIGKGNLRNNSQPVRQTAILYTLTEAKVYIQDWEHIFELAVIPPSPAERYHDTWAEYWNDATAGDYADPIWI